MSLRTALRSSAPVQLILYLDGTHWCLTIWNSFVIGFVGRGVGDKVVLSCYPQDFYGATFSCQSHLITAQGAVQASRCSVLEDTGLCVGQVRYSTWVLLCGRPDEEDRPFSKDDHGHSPLSSFLSLLTFLLSKFFECSPVLLAAVHAHLHMANQRGQVASSWVINWHRCSHGGICLKHQHSAGIPFHSPWMSLGFVFFFHIVGRQIL